MAGGSWDGKTLLVPLAGHWCLFPGSLGLWISGKPTGRDTSGGCLHPEVTRLGFVRLERGFEIISCNLTISELLNASAKVTQVRGRTQALTSQWRRPVQGFAVRESWDRTQTPTVSCL